MTTATICFLPRSKNVSLRRPTNKRPFEIMDAPCVLKLNLRARGNLLAEM